MYSIPQGSSLTGRSKNSPMRRGLKPEQSKAIDREGLAITATSPSVSRPMTEPAGLCANQHRARSNW